MLIEVQSLRKTFPGTAAPVLGGIDLTLAPGETLALTGESGSGKSTLLHIVGGLEPADSGSVLLAGTELTGLNDAGRAGLRRTEIGIVFQQFNLIPSLNVRRNITFQAELAGHAFGPDRLASLIDDLGLAAHLDKYPEQLSGGQQQRVAIGRALLHEPKLVLADEPTGNLDETTADAVFDALLDQTRRADAGLLLVTHSERLAARADRRLHLSRGRLA